MDEVQRQKVRQLATELGGNVDTNVGIIVENFDVLNSAPSWDHAKAELKRLRDARYPPVQREQPIDEEDALHLKERDLRLSVNPAGPRSPTLGDAVRARQRRRHSHVFGRDDE